MSDTKHLLGVKSSWGNDSRSKGVSVGMVGRIEWLKRFSHLECLCYIVCLHVSRSKYLCRQFDGHCFREKHFVSSQGEEDIWPQGGDRAPGSFVLCSWFCHYSPAGSQRSVKGDTTPGSADEA